MYANLLQRIGRNDEAAFHFEAGTRLKPNSADAHYSYAAFLWQWAKMTNTSASFGQFFDSSRITLR